MISRSISLLLIATILGCPLRCENPLMGILSAADSVESAVTTHSCCGHCGPQQHESSSPAPVSDDAVCQCLCGGAILGDDVMLANAAEMLAVFPAVCDLNTTITISEPDFDRSDPGPTGSENQGRLLRTLRMSFLC